MTNAELAVHLVRTTRDLLLSVRGADMFSAGWLGQAGDQTANQFLVDALHDQRPDDALLPEQGNATACGWRCVWIVDQARANTPRMSADKIRGGSKTSPVHYCLSARL